MESNYYLKHILAFIIKTIEFVQVYYTNFVVNQIASYFHYAWKTAIMNINGFHNLHYHKSDFISLLNIFDEIKIPQREVVESIR